MSSALLVLALMEFTVTSMVALLSMPLDSIVLSPSITTLLYLKMNVRTGQSRLAAYAAKSFFEMTLRMILKYEFSPAVSCSTMVILLLSSSAAVGMCAEGAAVAGVAVVGGAVLAAAGGIGVLTLGAGEMLAAAAAAVVSATAAA
jgi:hypothetical protein